MLRFLKQLGYGILYLIFWGLTGLIIYLIFFRQAPSCFDNKQNQKEEGIDCGGPCIPCAIKALKPLSFSSVQIFENNGLISLLTEVSNPNLNYGSDNFEYRINFYDSENNLLDFKLIPSFIYAGETKELVEAGLSIGRKPARAEIILEKVDWKPVTEWQTPIVEASNIKFSMNQEAVVVNGLIQNPSNFQISEIIITAVLPDQFGREVGVSKTEIKNLAPFQRANFQVFVPFSSLVKDRINLNATRVTIKAKK